MKTFLILITSMTLITSNAFALGSSGGTGNHKHGTITCKVTENGWEEHFSGHNSCSDCLSKHGSCTERCYENNYTCTAEGTDSLGTIEPTVGFSQYSKHEARAEAIDKCYYRGLRGCRIAVNGCTTDSDLVSVDKCFKKPVEKKKKKKKEHGDDDDHEH